MLTTRACSVMYPAQNSIRGSGGSTAIPGPITRGPLVTAMSARGWRIWAGTYAGTPGGSSASAAKAKVRRRIAPSPPTWSACRCEITTASRSARSAQQPFEFSWQVGGTAGCGQDRQELLSSRRSSRPGLVTLEQARLLSGEIEPVGIVENAGESTKLTVYFGRNDRVYGAPAFEVIYELLYRREIGGATALLGVDGSAHGRR